MKNTKRIPYLKFDDGEEYYELIDPYFDTVLPDYLISKSGKILSKKRSKTDDYYKRVVYKRKRARNRINMRYDEIPIGRYVDELVAYNFLNTSYIKNEFDAYNMGIDKPLLFRKYSNIIDAYIIHRNGDISDDEVINIEYTNYFNYIRHCNNNGRKPIIKDIDKDIMNRIYNETNLNKTDISKLFNISVSGVHRIIKKDQTK